MAPAGQTSTGSCRKPIEVTWSSCIRLYREYSQLLLRYDVALGDSLAFQYIENGSAQCTEIIQKTSFAPKPSCYERLHVP